MPVEQLSAPPKPVSKHALKIGYFNYAAVLLFASWVPVLLSGFFRCQSRLDQAITNRWVLGGSLILWLLALGLESHKDFKSAGETRPYAACLWQTLQFNLPGLLLVGGMLAEPGAKPVYAGLFLVTLAMSIRHGLRQNIRVFGLADKSLIVMVPALCLLLTSQRGTSACAPVPTVTANMRAFQAMVETYSASAGVYPRYLAELEADGKKRQYWRALVNPFLPESKSRQRLGLGYSYTAYKTFLSYKRPPYVPRKQLDSLLGVSVLLKWDYPLPPYSSGLVLYKWNSPLSYAIYGTDEAGHLIQDKGRTLWLSNS